MLYKFLVIDEHDMQLGTFDCLKNALILRMVFSKSIMKNQRLN